MVEIEMRRNQQIDVAGSDAELRQALHEVVLRSGVVRMIPPRCGRWLPDHRDRVAGIDQDGAPARRADQVTGDLSEVRRTRFSVGQPELSKMQEVELMGSHQSCS